jgi:hypothetical protein
MRISNRLAAAALSSALVIAGAGLASQPTARPYHNGSVWDVSFIRIKPGMDEAYMSHLCGQWKEIQEAMKKEGIVLSYKVLACEAHSPSDYNLMLMTEYKDLTSMEANEDKADTVEQRVAGDDQKQMQGFKDRTELREMVGDRLCRELILSPKTK